MLEIRQRSMHAFIANAQRRMMEALDTHRTSEAVVVTWMQLLGELWTGAVDPEKLVVKKRTFKRLDAYTQGTHTAAALLRYRAAGISKSPGQDVRYMVVDDGAGRLPEGVRLPFELERVYDAEFYATELVRACQSIVSPMR